MKKPKRALKKKRYWANVYSFDSRKSPYIYLDEYPYTTKAKAEFDGKINGHYVKTISFTL